MVKKKKFQTKKTISVVLISIILFSHITPLFNDYLAELSNNDDNTDQLRDPFYDPSLSNFLYEDGVNEAIYYFNAKEECYILAEVNGTDFTSFQLDNEIYEVSYGINIFPKNFSDNLSSHNITIQQEDVDNKNYEWLIVEPLFIGQHNISVNLAEMYETTFNAGGPISILMQPNFSYNYLYLEILELGSKSIVLKNIFDPNNGYPEINSRDYSSFVEGGQYISFDLNLRPGTHVMRVSGNGSINYKILVDSDWDNDLIRDVEEIQKSHLHYLDPTIPNIWGYFEKADNILVGYSEGLAEGYYSFYIPESYMQTHYLYIDMFEGYFSDFIVDEDDLTLKDMNFSLGLYESNGRSQFYGQVEAGWHEIFYQYDCNKSSVIFFRINSETIITLDYSSTLDTDGDGEKDRAEYKSGSNPYDIDTDDDELPDPFDASPLTSLVLKNELMHQIVIPNDQSKNTLLNLIVKKPTFDYSTYSNPRLWNNGLNVSIYFVMRLFGNQYINRDTLVQFWKGHKDNVETYCLVDNYPVEGNGDAIPDPNDPNAEFTFIFAKPSIETFEFNFKFPVGHPAKEDNYGAIDLRFDFIWLVSYYNETSQKSKIVHYYDIEEDIIVQSFARREIDNVNYILASPDSMIENQVLWNLVQNPELEISGVYDPYAEEDIVGIGTVDYLNLTDQLINDRETTPILTDGEFVGETASAIIRPDGDIVNDFWSPSQLYSRINDEIISPSAGDGNYIIGPNNYIEDLTYCELDLSTFKMGSGKRVNNIKVWVRGKATTESILKVDFKTTSGGSSTTTLGLVGTSFSWESAEWIGNWENGKFNGLCLSQENLDSLTIGLTPANMYYPAGEVHIDAIYVEVSYQTYNETLLENEVLYVAGLQSNYDVLNKLNLKYNILNPTFAVNYSGDFQVFFSFNSHNNDLSKNMGTTNDIGTILEQNSICYTVSWYNVSDDTIVKYEQRADVEGFPILIEIKEFENATVLEVTKARGSAIPLNQIPNTIKDDLCDEIILENKTWIERYDVNFSVPTIKFQESIDIYKEVIDNRFDDVVRADLFFDLDALNPEINALEFFSIMKTAIKYMKTIDKILMSYLLDKVKYWMEKFKGIRVSIFEKYTKLSYRSITAQINRNVVEATSDFLNFLDRALDNHPELFSRLINKIDMWNAKYESSYLAKQTQEIFEEIDNIMDEMKNDPFIKSIGNKFKIAKIAGIIISTVSFLFTLWDMWNLLYLEAPTYTSNRTAEFILRLGVNIGGIILASVSIYALVKKSLFSSIKYLGSIVMVVGFILRIGNVVADILYAISIYDEYPDLAIDIIVKAVATSIATIVVDVFLIAALGTSWSTFGLSLIISVFFFWLSLIPPSSASFETILDDDTHFTFPTDNVKRHGTLEVGDQIGFNIKFHNTGTSLIEKLKFQARFRLQDGDEDWEGEWSEYQGIWDDHFSLDLLTGIKYYTYYYAQNEYWIYSFSQIITQPTAKLSSAIEITADKINRYDITGYESRTRIYGPQNTIIPLNLMVLENNIMSFYENTEPLPESFSLSQLERTLEIALEQYRWKDAQDALDEILQMDPEYIIDQDILINTNIGTNSQEDIIELDPTTGQVATRLSLNLDGSDNPIVDYALTAPEGFTITPSSSSGLPLNSYSATYNFSNDAIGSDPVGWTEDNFGSISGHDARTGIISEFNGHDKIYRMTGGPDYYLRLFQVFSDGPQQFGTVELFFASSSADLGSLELTRVGSPFHTHLAVVFVNDGFFIARDGSDHQLLPCVANQWHHISMSWERTTGGYMNLAQNKWKVIIDGNEFGDFDFGADYDPETFMLYNSGNSANPVSDTYIDDVGYSWDPNYEIGDNLGINSAFYLNLSADNPTQQLAGIYYFNMNITLHDTGELIYSEKVPFRIPFIEDLRWDQSNAIFLESFEDEALGLNESSPIYATTTIDKGYIINLKCLTTTNNEINLNLYNEGTLVKEFQVFPRGNLDLGEIFIQLIVDKTISFDQFMFVGQLDGEDYFFIFEFLIMDSLITPPDGHSFNPIDISNDGNIPEFIELSFSGVPFDYVDSSLYPEEFRGEKQTIKMMPGEHRECLFKIAQPTESISNLFWRGIEAKNPGTQEVFTSYVDYVAINGILIVNPLNITYNLFGKTMSAEEGFLLNVIPEEPLLWMAYSLDGQSMVPFSGSTLIPTPEEEGLHSILVFGINFEAELFESEMRYFSIKYPITIFSPENKTYFEFGEGLMLDFTSVKKLNSISYSLDGQDPISISGDITLPFPSIGAHSIVVNGTDIYGNEYCSAIRYFTIGINLWPEAEFEANVQTIVAGQSVSFMFLGFEGNPAATYSWDFGDGSNSNNQNPTHMYESSGIFTVTLTVTDNDDDVDIEIKSNYITVNPNQVTGLTATGGRNVISLSWSSSADSNFHHYNIYRNGVKLAETTSNSYTYSGLPDSTTYTFQVSAVNTAGMEGEKSNPVSATTLPPPPPDPVPVPGFTDSVMLASLILGVIAVLLRFHKKQQKIKQQK